MRLLLSAGRGPDGALVDLVVDCEDDATVGDLAAELARRVPPAHEQPFGAAHAAHVRDTGRRLGVVEDQPVAVRASSTGAWSVADRDGDRDGGGGGDGPGLFVEDQELDPAQPLVHSRVRHGALLGLGAPLTSTLVEPTGVVEVRIVSGPGAGTVRRLGIGRHRIGPDPADSVRLPVDGAPSVDLEVAVDGTVRVLDVRADAPSVEPPVRTVALPGPIVVPRPDEDQTQPAPRSRRGRRRAGREDPLPTVGYLTIEPADERAAVELDRVAVDSPTPWGAGSCLSVGPCVLEVVRPSRPDASLSPSPEGSTMDFNRPPRLLPAPRLTEFSLPKEPAKPSRQPIPVLVMIAPVVMGLGMYIVTQRVLTLMFIVLSPMLMVANWWQGRRTQASRHADQVREYEERRARVGQAAFEALLEERAARRRDAPDPAELLLQATGPRSRLWERRPTDPDWMMVRLGTADLPSEVVLSDPARERHQGALTWTAPDVPATVRLARAGVTGVAGRDGLPQQVGVWLVAQLAALHSPADLRIAVLVGGGSGSAGAVRDADPGRTWDWVRWLPHLREDGAGPLAAVGTDEETTARRVAELAALLDARREAATGAGGAAGSGEMFAPVLVVLDGSRALRLLPGMVTLLREGPAHGLYFLCLDTDVTLLPEECRVVVSTAHGGLRVETTGEATVEAVRADVVPAGWCERLARALAPVHDVSADGEVSMIPASSRLLDVLGVDPPSGELIARGWASGRRTTSAVIGEGADDVFRVDLRTDGPHGLVAGTTGSGKSELLQTLIASLAVGNRPDEMTFVLVDYKGGAAFKDCAHLPHTVGMVTDLDGHLTTRALESLGAELRRREHQLADAGAKDIDDYLAGRGDGEPPMPRLLIVIDEFAALVAELPDFVTGLVDIARRGRSLGVHLLLATQRPAGVVSAEIKSNTNLRIALRVTDAGDSQDVIESDVSAHIPPSLPGRAYARLGHSQLIPFQSSRVGGRPRGVGRAASVRSAKLDWEQLGRAVQRVELPSVEDDVTIPTDLALLVRSVGEAARTLGIPSVPSPWLPALPETVLLDDLLLDLQGGPRSGPHSDVHGGASSREAVPVRGAVPAIPLGRADFPSLQRQETMTWDLAGGANLAFAGQSRSGRSTALRLVAAGVARLADPRDVHLYGIDCGNGALLPLVSMPHVGAVVTRDQPDRVRRLLALLGGEVSRRQQLLAVGGYADIAEQRAAVQDDDRLPYLVLLLDRWEGFVGAFEQADGGQLLDQVLTLLREGQAVGLRAVLAGDRSMLVGRMGAVLEDRVLLRMPAPEDYSSIGMRSKDVPTRIPPGRAFRSGETATEVQLALVTADPAGTAQVAELQRLAAVAREHAGVVPAAQRPGRVDELPVLVSFDDAVTMREVPAARTALLVGVGGDTLQVRELDVDRDGPGFLVTGPQRSGRSTALLATVRDAAARRWKVTVVAPRRSPLRELAGTPGVRRVFTGEEPPDDLRAALDSKGPRLLVIDDFEVLGGEHALSVVAEEYLKGIRDTGDALVVACGVDEVTGMYRGVTATLRKTRTGLLLAPRSAADGDVFTARLPRSVGGAVPAGRGVLLRAGSWEWVQVPLTEVGPTDASARGTR